VVVMVAMVVPASLAFAALTETNERQLRRTARVEG